MCGQVGVIFGTKHRCQEEIEHLTDLFGHLLVVSQKRGRHATGVASLNRLGECDLYKQPVPAQKFVQDGRCRRVIQGVDNRTTILMGHTRWKTRGDARNNLNNHPIETEHTIGTHNGTITNADYLFWRYGLPREAEVDSEVIFRIADSVLHKNTYDLPAMIERLSFCRGEMSAVMASKTEPETIIIIKGDKPLEFRYHPGYMALLYASEHAFLDTVLAHETGWGRIAIDPMSVVTLHCGDLTTWNTDACRFAVQGRTWLEELST